MNFKFDSVDGGGVDGRAAALALGALITLKKSM